MQIAVSQFGLLLQKARPDGFVQRRGAYPRPPTDHSLSLLIKQAWVGEDEKMVETDAVTSINGIIVFPSSEQFLGFHLLSFVLHTLRLNVITGFYIIFSP